MGLCICFKSDILSVRVPYSWMFRRMCWVYACKNYFKFLLIIFGKFSIFFLLSFVSDASDALPVTVGFLHLSFSVPEMMD